MTDLEQRGYLERHAPANLEFDQISINIEVRMSGSSRTHHLFTNGRAVQDGGDAWNVTFPPYFTCSSCYLHLSDRPLFIEEDSFTGVESEIPLIIYGEKKQETKQALKNAEVFLKELEQSYGPYIHERLLIYCTGFIDGGMEYAGAAMTSLDALGHEITHSWFARGVIPADGNAGWIDEAIAQWRDQKYPRATAEPARAPVNLAGFSPYRRHTPWDSYKLGALLLSELQRLALE